MLAVNYPIGHLRLTLERWEIPQLRFRGIAGASGERDLAKLVLDGRGPILAQPAQAQQVLQGKHGVLQFAITESVPIGQGKILIGPAGKPAQAAALIEGLSATDFDPVKDGWQLRSQTLPVQEFAPGRYDLNVQLEIPKQCVDVWSLGTHHSI